MRPIKKSFSTSCEQSQSPKLSKDSNSKMHRRSRTGCYTCRLRRKKCDESRPFCRACKHLGVECEYKRPTWWVNADRRREHKENIKEIIKQTKLAEKPTQAARVTNFTPPSLCYSVATTSTFSDMTNPTRGASLSSHYSPPSDFDGPCDFFNATPMMPPPQWSPVRVDFQHFPPPFDVDIKTERQMFVNDIPTRKDSSISTFSIYQPVLPHAPHHPIADDAWVQQEYHESQVELYAEEPLDLGFFQHAHEPITSTHQAVVQVEECDQPLLDHFLENVAPFPILEVNQPGAARSDVILPALAENKCYLHCCLSTSALHLKATKQCDDEQNDNDIMRHRAATISELCEAFQNDVEHSQIIEAALGLVYFQSSVGSLDNDLPDIPWHQHFQAVTSLLQELDLQNTFQIDATHHAQAVFNMTLASWIDILGATMLRSAPVFCASYREKIEAGLPSGLAELMGCEDRVMYLISEIACLDNLKVTGALDDLTLCTLITNLGEQLSLTEACPSDVANVYAADTGSIRPAQLSKNITAVFRLAARIHLCSLVPDFDAQQPSIIALVDSVTEAMSFIPAGPKGFDKSLVWPLLIAGSVSGPASSFRGMLADRSEKLGVSATFGAFGRVRELLRDVWFINDEVVLNGGKGNVHWRDVMQQKGWDFLLI